MVNVEGLPVDTGRNHELQLDGLPFHGRVRIGKRSMLMEEDLLTPQ